MNERARLPETRESAPSRPDRRINVVLRSAAAEQGVTLPGVRPRTLPSEGPWSEWQRELDRLVGLEEVKALVYEIYALLQVGQMRAAAGLSNSQHVFHMIFKGNPGTGKTTVARILARLLQSMGVLSKGHLVEVERADLVGEYIGHTAQKTREWIRKAMGGILFVDEAYSLARGGEKDFGKEAIDTLVKAMEDHRNQFVLILAGYTLEMEAFLMSNPGLPSRFPIRMTFRDYTTDQLIQIAELMARERDYTLLPQTVQKLRQMVIAEKNARLYSFSNARFIRNVLERAIRNQAVRLLEQYPNGAPGRMELMDIRPEDLRMDGWE